MYAVGNKLCRWNVDNRKVVFNRTIDRLTSITALDYDDDFDYVFLADVGNHIARYFIQMFKDNYAQETKLDILPIPIKLKNFVAAFYGWRLTVSRLQSYYERQCHYKRQFTFYH